MAKTQKAHLIRSFGYLADDGTQHYFTRENADTIVDIIPEAKLQDYVKSGAIELYDAKLAPKIEAAKESGTSAADTNTSARREK